ncbi:helix-turn-helix domain protein [Streptococcus pneumoniae]|nr:helix-turn-helix domain protein [Streptococcus pneumoniae]
MRYDFGKVYKEIRESKGLTQEEVCGGVLSRTSLSKIESGKTTPKYENMEFLLRQINMSFEEFEYICQLYQPSQRTEIMQTYLNMRSIIGTSDLVNLFQKCQDYLKTHHDLPIEEIRDMLEVVIYIRQHGAGELSDHAEQVVKKLWRKIEKQDTWYESDLKILNTILFSFPIEYLHLITGKILQRLEVYKNYQHLYDLRIAILLNLSTLLEVYKNYQHLYDLRIAILLNLSTLYLYNQDKNMCKQICYTLLEDAKNKKSYDRLAICYVRIGICTDDSKLIQKGFSLLELTEETSMLSHLKKEVEIYYQAKER